MEKVIVEWLIRETMTRNWRADRKQTAEELWPGVDRPFRIVITPAVDVPAFRMLIKMHVGESAEKRITLVKTRVGPVSSGMRVVME